MSPAFCHPEDLADHNYDLRKHEPRRHIDQRYAIAALVGYCEGICQVGALNEQAEIHLRHLVAETLTAFEMPTKAERAHDLLKHEADGSIRLVPA
jgi:hypothetical protein